MYPTNLEQRLLQRRPSEKTMLEAFGHPTCKATQCKQSNEEGCAVKTTTAAGCAENVSLQGECCFPTA